MSLGTTPFYEAQEQKQTVGQKRSVSSSCIINSLLIMYSTVCVTVWSTNSSVHFHGNSTWAMFLFTH